MKKPEMLNWIRFAEMDRNAAHMLYDKMYPKPLEIICFHSQQCVEKLLKGFLIDNSLEAPKIHDLPILCDMCVKVNERCNELNEVCEFLTT